MQLRSTCPSAVLTFSTALLDLLLSPALFSHWCFCLKLLSELQPTKDATPCVLKGWHRAGMTLTSPWLLCATQIQAEGTGQETVSAEPLPNSLPGGPCSKWVAVVGARLGGKLHALPLSTLHPTGKLVTFRCQCPHGTSITLSYAISSWQTLWETEALTLR